jgi:hypothetical protein
MSSLVDDVLAVLIAIDFPFDSLPNAWAKRTPKVILAMGELAKDNRLSNIKSWGDDDLRIVGSRQLISRLNERWDEAISSGSYDEVRRRCVRFLVAAGAVLKDPDNPSRAPNSPATGYALSPSFGRLLRAYKTDKWDDELSDFIREQGSLREALRAARERVSVSVVFPEGSSLLLSPGAHNVLQAAIISDFLPQFVSKPEVIYIADALNRQLHKDANLLAEVGLFALDHRQLPDVVVLDRERG